MCSPSSLASLEMLTHTMRSVCDADLVSGSVRRTTELPWLPSPPSHRGDGTALKLLSSQLLFLHPAPHGPRRLSCPAGDDSEACSAIDPPGGRAQAGQPPRGALGGEVDPARPPPGVGGSRNSRPLG